MAAGEGRTTTRVNLRKGPGTDSQVVRVLEPMTLVSILEDTGAWLRVETGGQQGFVHERFVAQQGQAVPAGFMIHQPGLFAEAPLETPVERQIKLPAGATAAEKLVARTWNRAGNMLALLAQHLKIDPGAGVAVFCVESGGKGFGPDGRMIIRFENHHFFRHWGKAHRNVFDRHFRFNPVKTWLGHEWRAIEGEPFKAVHLSQSSEWAVFNFARELDDPAAKLSISMGGPQIMGSNYADAGFESVQEMFDRFSNSEKGQIVAFFDFLQGHETHPRKVIALQQNDFLRFAELYNGPGNAAVYGAKITQLFETFQRLRPASLPAVA